MSSNDDGNGTIDIPFDDGDSAWGGGGRTPSYVHEIAVKKNQTANRVVQILIWAYVLSLPMCIIAVVAFEAAFGPADSGEFSSRALLFRFIDKWFTGALAAVGTSIGFYFGERRGQED